MLGVLALALGMTLASCGVEPAPVPVSGDGLTHSEIALLSPSVVNLNASTYEALEDPIFPTSVGEETFSVNNYDLLSSGYQIINSNYASYGLLVVRNSAERVGFYSLLHQDFIVAPQYVNEWLDYFVNGVDRIGFLLKTRYDNVYKVYDGFGNILWNRNYDPDLINPYSVYTTVVNEKTYLNIGDTYYFEYAEDGTAEEVSYIPEPVPVEPEVYIGPSLNDLYTVGWLDLTPYGYPNVSIAEENSLFTVFNGTTPISSFYVDISQYRPLGLFSEGRLLFQGSTILPEHAENYSYSIGNVKYSLNTFVVDIMSGLKTSLDYRVVFSGLFTPIALTETTLGYVARYKEITAEKVLENEIEVIVDGGLVFHDDVSGIKLGDFTILKNSNNQTRYYNESTKILYDQNFRVITYLSEMNPTYSQRMNAFVGYFGGLKGVVNVDGRVVVEFKYNQILEDSFYDGAVLATQGTELYRCYFGSHDSLLGKNYQYIGKNYVKFDDNDGYKNYYSVDGNVLLKILNDYSQSTYYFEYLNGQRVYFTRKSSFSSDSVSFYTVRYTNFIPHAINGETKGSEDLTSVNNGTSDQPYTLSKVINTVHYTKNSDGRFYVRLANNVYTTLSIDSDSVNLWDNSYVDSYFTSNGRTYYRFYKPSGEDEYIVSFYRAQGNNQTTDIYCYQGDGYLSPSILGSATSVTMGGIDYSLLGMSTYEMTFSLEITATANYNFKPTLNFGEAETYTESTYRVGNKDYYFDDETGVDVLEGTTITMRFTIYDYDGSSFTVDIAKNEIQAPVGRAYDNPLMMTYGDANYNFESSIIFKNIYAKFECKYGGTYSFGFNFGYNFNSINIYYFNGYNVSKDTYSYSTYYYNTSKTMDINSYVIFEFVYSSAYNITFNYVINASKGSAIENPAYITTTSDFSYDYKFCAKSNSDSENSESYVLTLNQFVPSLFIINGDDFTPVSGLETVFTIQPNSTVYFLNNSGSKLSASILNYIETPVSVKSGDNFNLGEEVEYYRYTNETEEAVKLSITFEVNDYGVIGINYGIGFTTPNKSSAGTYTYIVDPGDSVSVSGYGYSNSCSLSFVVDDLDSSYTVDNVSQESYNWSRNNNRGVVTYSSTNTMPEYQETYSRMNITCNATGTFRFEFKVSGNYYNAYLNIYKNGSIIANRYYNYSSFTVYSFSVNEEDVITFEYYNVAYGGSEYCTTIRNISIY